MSAPRILEASRAAGRFKIGDIIHGYKLEKMDFIKELKIRPYYLRHQSTGAEHLHVEKEGDSNNVFGVYLRTTPKNSTGVAHILEHLALTGSKKYPIRDPFFKMLTRSLATYMNACTAPDCTLYPFATQNSKDFENLLSVYTDAVFFPRLRPVDFRQEGWRLEHEDSEKEETPIVIKGVVYNEMKGAFSSSSAVYARCLLNHLFPDTTYKHESGGDPEHIPKLTHEDLKKFHQLHYHPSNAKFFTYGDLPMENHLKLINEMVLSKFSENSLAREQSLVQEQSVWLEPRKMTVQCPPDPMATNPDKQTTTSISYMLPTLITNYEELFALQILSTLLISGPNAPFYKSLLESGIGSDFSPSTGLGTYTRQPYFSIGLQNLHKDDVPKIHKIIEETLVRVAQEGFPNERIEAVLHDIELSIKHVRGNYGLRLAFSIMSAWTHDGDIIDYFKVNEIVTKFRNDLKSNPCYWKELVTKNFLTNNHKLVLTMNPDEKFDERRKEKERALLEDKISKLTDVDKKTVLYEGMELKKIQETKEDPSILPGLEPSRDISRDLSYRTELKFQDLNGVNVQLCEQPTNEIVYFRAKSDIGAKLLSSDLMEYLPLFCDVATKMGAGKYNRQELSQKAQLTTGGLGVSMMINPSLFEFDQFKVEVCFGSHCLKRNVHHMFELWSNVFKQIHFNDNHEFLHQLIKQSASELSESIAHAGSSYAAKKSVAGLSSISGLDERLSGLTFVAKMKDMASKEKVNEVAGKLQAIAKIALDPFSMKCAINAEPEAISITTEELGKLVESTQAQYEATRNTQMNFGTLDYEPTKVEDLKFPFATHYVAKGYPTVPRMHKDFPKLVIMSKLLTTKYLLQEVREKGGAYGAYARIANSGILNFSSYRDPNTDETLKIFDSSAGWITRGEDYTERDIEESKLGVFQDVDRPVEPGNKGLNYFTIGETDDMRQDFRRALLDVTKDDVVQAAEKYLKQKKYGTFVI